MLLGYENEAIKAQEEGEDVEYVDPAVDDPDRNPDRGHHRRARARAQDFLDFIWSDEGQEIWADNGYRPVNPAAGRHPDSSRPRRTCSRSTSSVAGAKSTTSSSTTKPARSPRSRRNSESPPSSCHGGIQPGNPHPSRPGQASACPGSGPASAAAWSCSTCQPDGPAAAGGGRGRIARAAASSAFWDSGLEPAGGRRAEADRDLLADRRRDQRRSSARSSPGSWSATSSPARARQRGHRPPLRAADDRRRPDPARRSTAPTARSASTSPSPGPRSSSPSASSPCPSSSARCSRC